MKTDLCFFASDLHGHKDKYEKLFYAIESEHPSLVFLGGDLLPSVHQDDYGEIGFLDYLYIQLKKLKSKLGEKYPLLCLILGNDDARINECHFVEKEKKGLWVYINEKMVVYKNYRIYGYSYIPPTPFLLKDWEKYDVSTYVDPGCVHPTEGYRSVKPAKDFEYSTIKNDLDEMTKDEQDFQHTLFLFHSPPYKTNLDRAALDGKMVDHVPLDVHIGSIAIQRFIKKKQPFVTMHGHVHESSGITGFWQDKIKETFAFSGCYDRAELAIVKYYLENPENAWRDIY